MGTDCGTSRPHFWELDCFQFSIFHLLSPIVAISVNHSQKWEPVMYISLLVLQNKHDLTSFKEDCRYYILIAIILIPTYPVLGAIILKLAHKRCPTTPKFKGIERSSLFFSACHRHRFPICFTVSTKTSGNYPPPPGPLDIYCWYKTSFMQLYLQQVNRYAQGTSSSMEGSHWSSYRDVCTG